jgi:hypothetical protein
METAVSRRECVQVNVFTLYNPVEYGENILYICTHNYKDFEK